MLKVKKNSLLMIACLVWGIAGINILRIGLLAYPAYVTVGNIILSVAVFSVFQYFIFGKLVKKAYTENTDIQGRKAVFPEIL